MNLDIIMSRKNIKQKDVPCCCMSACQIGREEKELLCRFALLLHSSSFNWKTSSIMLCMTIFLCHFLPAHHNIITFHFSSQGPIFSFIQDNSCEAQPWCLLRWRNAFVFCFSLTNSNFHTPAWQIFLLKKRGKNAFSPETFMGLCKGASGYLVLVCTVIYPGAKLFWKYVEKTNVALILFIAS